MKIKKVLLTGIGGCASIGVTRCLKGHYEMAGTDCNPNAIVFSETHENYLIPKATDVAYLDTLNDVIARSGADFVHPQPDIEVFEISRNRSKIDAVTRLPRHEIIEVFQDKYKSYEAWKSAGIPQPETRLMMNEKDLEKAFAEYEKPFWIRAKTGAGGRGSLIVKSLVQAVGWVNAWNGWGNFIASEMLLGRLLTWQSVWDDGELIIAQGRERLSWGLSTASTTGVTGMTGVARTVARSDLDEIAIKAIKAVDSRPHGIYGVDAKENNEGVPCPTEINIGRFFTTVEFFKQAGVNMPLIHISLAEGKQVDVEPWVEKLNPIKGEYYWFRTPDCLPVFLSKGEVEEKFVNLQKEKVVLEPDASVYYGLRK